MRLLSGTNARESDKRCATKIFSCALGCKLSLQRAPAASCGYLRIVEVAACAKDSGASAVTVSKINGAYGIRTRDLLNAIEALYQLS